MGFGTIPRRQLLAVYNVALSRAQRLTMGEPIASIRLVRLIDIPESSKLQQLT